VEFKPGTEVENGPAKAPAQKPGEGSQAKRCGWR
jgi:hypothetical protein